MDEITNQYENPLEECESQMVQFLPELRWQEVDLSTNWLDLTEEQIQTHYTLSYNGVRFAPLGGIHALTGQAGHGKTAFFTMLMVAVLKGEYCGLRYELRSVPLPRVLYIDTEMEKGNTQLVVRRLYKMMGWDRHTEQDQFRVLRLREEDKANERWKKTLKAIHEVRPTVVFLDGFIDVLNDFNDNKECSEVIYQDMKAASFYNLSFWNILHQNPGSTKMVGHSGSFLERKTTDVFMVQKDKEGGVVSFTAKQLKARGKDVEDIQYMFRDDEEHIGIPFIDTKDDNDSQPVVSNWNMEQLIKCADLIGTKAVSFTTYRQRIKDEFHVGSDKAKEAVNASVKMNLVVCNDNKYTKAADPLFDQQDTENAYQDALAGMEADDIIDEIF